MHLMGQTLYFSAVMLACGEKEAMVMAAADAAKLPQSCPTLCDPIDGSPPGSPVPGILQARTLGVGCHFLLQCTKVKIESEVAQSCLTFSDLDCSLPNSSIHGIFQAKEYSSGVPLPSPKTDFFQH